MITEKHLEELKSKYRFDACKIIANAESEQRFLTEKENKQLTKFEEKMYECDKKLWALKYHATRTEELDLPMWEEIEKIKEKDVYIIAKPKEMRFYIDYKFLIPQIKLCTLEDVFNWNLDEEGYLSACDLCLKLFKGEE